MSSISFFERLRRRLRNIVKKEEPAPQPVSPAPDPSPRVSGPLHPPVLQRALVISDTRLSGCHPVLKERVRAVIIDLYNEERLVFAVHSGLRTRAEQAALYAQGRESINEIARLRQIAKMPMISGGEARRRVTGVRFSWHNTGLAADIVEYRNQRWSWANVPHYKKIGKYAKRHGLDWGGNWRSFKDYPHLQLPMGISLRQASRMTDAELNQLADKL